MIAETTFLPRSVDAKGLIRELMAASPNEGDVVAFDADGTLWSGDVGEDVFLALLEKQMLREPAIEALAVLAARHGIEVGRATSDVGRAIREAERRGRFPEREMFEVMALCYAGFSLAELREHVEVVLARVQLRRRLNPALAPVIDWARRAGLRTVVISASPKPIIEIGARLWGFAAEDVFGATPIVERGFIAPRLARPVPYKAIKVELGRALLRGKRWLSSFGDSGFDIDMLLAARVGVAVTPKPELRAALGMLANVVVLG